MINAAGKQTVVMIAALLVLCLFSSSLVHAELAKGKAPDFTLKSLRGNNLKLSEHRGEVIMLNFWATWCTSCREEMLVLNELYQKYRDSGFTLWAINVEENADKVTKWLRDVAVIFPVLFDRDTSVSKRFKVDAMPSTLLIDRDGNLRFVYRDYEPGDEDEYHKQVRELMRE